MRRIEATIEVDRFDAVKCALVKLGVRGLTIADVRELTDEPRTMSYRGVVRTLDTISKVRVGMVVPDRIVKFVVDLLVSAARTGKPDDGVVVVSDVVSVTRIRNGETDCGDEEMNHREEQPAVAQAGRSRWNVPSYQHKW